MRCVLYVRIITETIPETSDREIYWCFHRGDYVNVDILRVKNCPANRTEMNKKEEICWYDSLTMDLVGQAVFYE